MNTNDIIVCLIIVLLFAMFAYIYSDECGSTGGNPPSGGKRIETMVPVAAPAPAATIPSTIQAANYEAIMNVSGIYNDSMATFTGLNVKDNTTTKSLKVSTIDSSTSSPNVSINSPLIVTSSIKFDPKSKFCVDDVCLDPPYLKNMIRYYQPTYATQQPTVPGQAVQPILPYMYSPMPSDYKIYDDIFSAQAQGVWSKYGVSLCYNDTGYSSTPWNGYTMVGIGWSTNDAGGIYVNVPANMSVIWIRVLNDRWSVYKINSYLNYVCGHRNIIRLRPNGGVNPPPEDVGQLHRWVPYPVPGPGKYLLSGGKKDDSDCPKWISGIAFSTNPNNHTYLGAINFYWGLNGDKNVVWHSHNWGSDNLAGLPGNSTITIILPVVNSKNDKMLYILTRGNGKDYENETATLEKYTLSVNGVQLGENFRRYDNTFSRFYDTKTSSALVYFGAKIPAAIISGTSIIVTITTGPGGVYFREMGTHNF